MSSSIIVLDSSDDEAGTPSAVSNTLPTLQKILRESPNTVSTKSPSPELNGYSNITQKRSISKTPEKESIPKTKRIKPTLLSKNIDRSRFETESPVITFGKENEEILEKDTIEEAREASEVAEETSTEDVTEDVINGNPITPTFAALLEECKKADPSEDMSTLIEKKLLKYYHLVHPDFVSSRGFCKTVKAVIDEIKTTPELVYYQLKTIFEELKIRRKSKSTVMSNEEMTSTGNERRDRQIRRLSKGLLDMTKRITKLEESDVDLEDEDNSTFLQVERFKKQACMIYEKICDLTGESKHAHRSVKKPIFFQGTCYPQFNKTIQSFVNRTNTFPDFFDVLRCLEHCNVQYGFDLRADEVKKIAQDAFVKIGKSLQDRRKTDLYETVSHFTGTSKDPAQSDQTLNAKLTENQKFHAKIGTIIDRFAKEQELAAAELKEKHNTSGHSVNNDDHLQQSNVNEAQTNSDTFIDELLISNNEKRDKEVPKDTINNNKENEPFSKLKDDFEKNKTSAVNEHVEEIVISDEEDS